jgi:hypothetical protein
MNTAIVNRTPGKVRFRETLVIIFPSKALNSKPRPMIVDTDDDELGTTGGSASEHSRQNYFLSGNIRTSRIQVYQNFFGSTKVDPSEAIML